MNRSEFMLKIRPVTFPFVMLRDELRYIKAKFLFENNPRKLTENIYKKTLGKMPDLDDPQDLNEKISWLKLYSDTSKWTELADKYKVREYIKQCGFGEMLTKLYGVWDSPEEIDFEKLPNSFVLKTTNASGTVIVVKDKTKLDLEKTKNQLKEWIRRWPRIAIKSGEFHYLPIKPRVIAEEFLQESNSFSKTLIDYKIWCFSGEPYNVWACYDRISHPFVALYDLNWQYHPEYSIFNNSYKRGNKNVPRPKSLDKMLEACRVLSKDFPQVRIDFYEVNGKPYFGEMTFTSLGGRMNFYTPEYLLEMGEKVILPKEKIINKFSIKHKY